jgi:hypothetical protein
MSVSTRKPFENKVRLALTKERMLGWDNSGTIYRTVVTGKIRGLDMLLFLALASYHDIKEIGTLLQLPDSKMLFDHCYGNIDAKKGGEGTNIAQLGSVIENALGEHAEKGFEGLNLWLDTYNELLDSLTTVQKVVHRMDFAVKKLRNNQSLRTTPEAAAGILVRAMSQPEPARFVTIVNNTIRGDDNTVAAYRMVGFGNGAPVIKTLDYNARVAWEHALKAAVDYAKMVDRVPFAAPQRQDFRPQAKGHQGKRTDHRHPSR